jgi:bifunctional non-homologous end joining protein LigD
MGSRETKAQQIQFYCQYGIKLLAEGLSPPSDKGHTMKSMPAQDRLRSYREKRDFKATSEPEPSPSPQARPSQEQPGEMIFVVQKHEARTLHYDLRLEVEGVLRSWAVPKGPSMDPKDKRLAIETEDHPLEYAGFEGTIPKGEYGAGTVTIWDYGVYRNITEQDGLEVPMSQALEKGHAAFWLEGRRLLGGFALTRTKRGWILVKMRDEHAGSKDL